MGKLGWGGCRGEKGASTGAGVSRPRQLGWSSPEGGPLSCSLILNIVQSGELRLEIFRCLLGIGEAWGWVIVWGGDCPVCRSVLNGHPGSPVSPVLGIPGVHLAAALLPLTREKQKCLRVSLSVPLEKSQPQIDCFRGSMRPKSLCVL